MHLVLLSCRLPHCCVLYLAYTHLMKTPASKSEMKQSRTLSRDAEETTELPDSPVRLLDVIDSGHFVDTQHMIEWFSRGGETALSLLISHDKSGAQQSEHTQTHNMLILQLSYKIQSMNIEAFNLNNWKHHIAIFPNEDTGIFMTNDLIIITINPT